MFYSLCFSLIPALFGFVFVDLFFAKEKTMSLNSLLLRLSLGTGLGVGLYSCFTFVSLLFFNQSPIPLLILDAFVLIFCVLYLIKNKSRFELCEACGEAPNKIIFYLFIFSLIFAFATFFVEVKLNPFGNWDGMFIWNLHTNYLFALNDSWQKLFGLSCGWLHLDYPLLLPMANLRGFILTQDSNVFFPVYTQFLLVLSIIGTLFCSIQKWGGKNFACASVILLLGSVFFIVEACGQSADVVFSFFVLASIVLAYLSTSSNNSKLMIVAGLSAALSAWCKNEGALFVVAFVSVNLFLTLFENQKVLKRILFFLLGLLPVMSLVLFFKVKFAVPNELFANQTFNIILANVSNLERWKIIAENFVSTFFSLREYTVAFFAPLALGLFLRLLGGEIFSSEFDVRFKSENTSAIFTLLVVFVGYFFIYLITPQNLEWHLQTSLNRLFLQYWPSLIFVCAMSFSGFKPLQIQTSERNH